MREALHLAEYGMTRGDGGPFGAVVVLAGEIIGRGWNRVLATNDPTAHAEVVAIREACEQHGHFHLDQAVLYTSCEPCPMCLGAVFWARMQMIFYASTRQDAQAIGFDDEIFYAQLALTPEARSIPAQKLLPDAGAAVFRQWQNLSQKKNY
jgi:tRNA(Arg) A34 adenosine deaminase TadA